MKTYLKIIFERPEDQTFHEWVLEGKNDGVLYAIYEHLTILIHYVEKLVIQNEKRGNQTS